MHRDHACDLIICPMLCYSDGTDKGRYSPSWEPHLRATGRHLPYGITRCYLSPETSERAPPNPSHAGWYSIYLPRRYGRLSWPSWLDSTPAGSRTSDLSITSPTPNHCTTKTTKTDNNIIFTFSSTITLDFCLSGECFWSY